MKFDRGYHNESQVWENIEVSNLDCNIMDDVLLTMSNIEQEIHTQQRHLDHVPFLCNPLPTVGEQVQRIYFSANSTYDYGILRNMLIKSFKIQFDLQQIYWPTRFSPFSRSLFPLTRISERVQGEDGVRLLFFSYYFAFHCSFLLI